MYSLRATVLPVWLTWWAWEIQLESAAVREVATVAPNTSYRTFTGAKPLGPPNPGHRRQ